MKIVAICGSPRRGNTEFILKRILTKAEELGARTELVLLREKRIEFCNGCLNCDFTGECNIRDDMQIIYPKLKEADLIILGSPNYFSNVSGMMKNFIDRLNPFYTNKKLRNKKVVAVVVGGTDKPNTIKNSIKSIELAVDWTEMSLIGDLYLVGEGPQDIENDPESIQKIDEFTESLISS
ncbi:flavodoxin family protein [Candidatus Parcubacteria bacterium]|nr:flavodoxin family protein [Candidatus Parcubacteria bacterium]